MYRKKRTSGTKNRSNPSKSRLKILFKNAFYTHVQREVASAATNVLKSPHFAVCLKFHLISDKYSEAKTLQWLECNAQFDHYISLSHSRLRNENKELRCLSLSQMNRAMVCLICRKTTGAVRYCQLKRQRRQESRRWSCWDRHVEGAEEEMSAGEFGGAS